MSAELDDWTDEQLRVAIARTRGWQIVPSRIRTGWILCKPDGSLWSSFWHAEEQPTFSDCIGHLPDYLNDLNAMHEAENVLNSVQRIQFYNHLGDVIRDASPTLSVTEFDRIHATARQRAVAFCRTLNLKPETR